MGSRVFWSYSDNDGENPTGTPADFEFEIWYEFFDFDPERVPQIEITGVTCRSVHFDGEPERSRTPTTEEEEEFSEWFSSYLDSHPKEFKAVQNQAREHAYVEPDYDDIDE